MAALFNLRATAGVAVDGPAVLVVPTGCDYGRAVCPGWAVVMAAAPWVVFRRLAVRVPWWLVLLVLVPSVLWRLTRFTFRHRRALPPVAAALWLWWAWDHYGWPPLLAVAVTVSAGLAVWAWRWRGSWRRWVWLPVLSRWRRFWIYRRQWAESLSLCGLHKSFDSNVLLPALLSVRCGDATDEVVLRMLRGQTPEAYHRAGPKLAYSFGFRACRVFSTRRGMAPHRSGRLAPLARLLDRWRYRDRPRLVTLLFIRRDALTTVVTPFPVPAVPDFTALVVGMREDLHRYALRLLATHVLIAGATRAGKGSVIWSIVRALAGGIGSGLVRLWGIDPKGGMELSIGRGLFSRYEFQDYTAMADVFDDAVIVMRRRQDQLSGRVRVHTPTLDEPLYVIVIDELSALTAYLHDNDLRNRIRQSLGLLLSQGAGLGILIIGATQDPRKETVELRDLFPTRIALRVNEPGHVDLIMGDGARDRGALADQIPNDPAHQGIGYVEWDGHPEPARVRFSYLTDDDIRAMAATFPAAPELLPARPAPVASKPAARQHTYRPSSLTDGPLLPPGLLDALRSTDNEGKGPAS